MFRVHQPKIPGRELLIVKYWDKKKNILSTSLKKKGNAQKNLIYTALLFHLSLLGKEGGVIWKMYNVINFLVIFVWCHPLVIYSIFCFLWHDIKGNISLCRKLFCVTGIICMKYYHLIENNFFCQNLFLVTDIDFPWRKKIP